MPIPALKNLAKEANKSLKEAEEAWKSAKEIAKKEKKGKNYAYVVGITKNILGLEKNENFESSDVLGLTGGEDLFDEEAMEKAMRKTPVDYFDNDYEWINNILYKYIVYSDEANLTADYEQGVKTGEVLDGKFKEKDPLFIEEEDFLKPGIPKNEFIPDEVQQ